MTCSSASIDYHDTEEEDILTKRTHWFAAVCLLPLLSEAAPENASPATPSRPCIATAIQVPICGLRAPEDLDTLGNSELLVVQMRGMTGRGESNFATIDAKTGAVRVLARREAAGAPSWGDGSCPAPDRMPGFHGFDRW